MIDSITQFIDWTLLNLDYWNIFLLMTIESSFIPFPSEVIIPPAAYMAAAGELNIYLVLLSGTLGALLGAIINYFLAFYLGRPLIYKLVETRLAKMLLLDKEKLDKSEKFFVKNGVVSTLVGRLLPVIRQLISIPAGLAAMPLFVFVIYTTIGAFIWNVILGVIGYSLYSVVPKEELLPMVKLYSHEISYSFLGVVILALSWIIIRKYLKKRKKF